MILDNIKIKKIHMIGIDGISMSGLGEILISLGYKITGSDLNYSKRLKALEDKGAIIYKGHNAKNVVDQDIIVHTAAVKEDNPEMKKGALLNIPRIDRSILLGEIMNKYKERIAISGTHGKSTTTAMTALILLNSDIEPTVHIGAEFKPINGTTYIGGNEIFITEACEYTETYLKLCPSISVITNIEFDHGDYFKDINHVKTSFAKFLNLLPKEGVAVLNFDDKYTQDIIPDLNIKNILTYSTKNKNAFVYADNLISNEMGNFAFDLFINGEKNANISMQVPGIYNVYNALASITTAIYLKIPISSIKSAVESFLGTARRFEYKGSVNNIRVIDDYAHHPSEIKSTLNVFTLSEDKTIWCVFQSHTYTRTKLLLNDFGNSFGNTDKVIVADIYAAREIDTGEVSGKILSDEIQKAGKDSIYISGFENICKYLIDNAKPNDIIITMGAGDIHNVGEMFLKTYPK